MLLVTLLTFLLPLSSLAATPIPISVPSSPPTRNVVEQNFLGISFELSFMNLYFGNDTSTIPPTVINYLSALRSRVGNNPLRMRIGGNSMDSSIYVPTQTSPMTQLIDGSSNSDDQPVNFGPVLWDVLDQVGSTIGGAAYLIGSAQQILGSSLDGFLLGNEPDLYTSHQERPNIANYTTALYMDEFRTASNLLTNTSGGNILSNHDIGGPTICCFWNLDALLDDGYISNFTSILKYISLQHYPQNNCFGSHAFDIPYYIQHANVVNLAAWEESGIDKVISSTSPNKPKVIMSEFNSASCGGVPGVSDTFAVGSLWTVDYALQMASMGYSAAYIHTREQGVTYNIFSPPNGPDGGPGPWTTNPPYYGLLVAAEALHSKNGSSIVTDLNIQQSKTDLGALVSGYAVYDAGDSTVQQLVLFNYANVSSSDNSSMIFSVPANVFSSNSAITANIAWGGQTFSNVGDGKPVSTNASWAPANVKVDCSNGCSISVPGPGLAVVFASEPQTQPSGTATSSDSTSANSTSATKSGARIILPNMDVIQFFAVLCALVAYSRLL
ncbi:hypothetical protein BYT27DRAFT_7220918 [Phlegmacium glaucopus]|nr:hypothetical protein BYT27DRAFT_7220918 [Phlegmacium glaucopus]